MPVDTLTLAPPQGSNYYGPVHDGSVNVTQASDVAFFLAHDASAGRLVIGSWSEQTSDVLGEVSCGVSSEDDEPDKTVRAKEVAQARRSLSPQPPAVFCNTPTLQRLCEECHASCTGISSSDQGPPPPLSLPPPPPASLVRVMSLA
jgi:hypothetical protein